MAIFDWRLPIADCNSNTGVVLIARLLAMLDYSRSLVSGDNASLDPCEVANRQSAIANPFTVSI